VNKGWWLRFLFVNSIGFRGFPKFYLKYRILAAKKSFSTFSSLEFPSNSLSPEMPYETLGNLQIMLSIA